MVLQHSIYYIAITKESTMTKLTQGNQNERISQNLGTLTTENATR